MSRLSSGTRTSRGQRVPPEAEDCEEGVPQPSVRRPQFSWTRIKGESDVQGGSGNGSVEEGAGSWVGADGGSPKGDRSRRRRCGGWGPGLGARAAVECEPEAGRGAAAAVRRVTRRGLACSRGGDLSAGGVEGAGGGRSLPYRLAPAPGRSRSRNSATSTKSSTARLPVWGSVSGSCCRTRSADRFVSMQAVQQLSDAWLATDNEHRPHDALGRVPPLTYLARVTTRSESNHAWSS